MIKNFGYDFKRYKIASRTVVDNPELVKVLAEEKKHLYHLDFGKQRITFSNSI